MAYGELSFDYTVRYLWYVMMPREEAVINSGSTLSWSCMVIKILIFVELLLGLNTKSRGDAVK